MSDWIAITGGCGYVGSHIAAAIKENTKFKTLVIDRRAGALEHTHAYADKLVDDDYISAAALSSINTVRPKAIIHCAASSLVGPSVADPAAYYENNVSNLKILLDHMRQFGHENIVFSSSSSVYGDGTAASAETDLLEPLSPYGKTKQVGEMLLQDYSRAYGINSIAFRYFNAVGAAPGKSLGQEPGASHLIARIMESIAADQELTIYGDDWPTEDGTCVRDYVHVSDIAHAHIMGVVWLLNNPGYHVYNIGSGSGYSVKQIIDAVENTTGHKIKTKIGPRREGDPAWRAADTTRISNDIGWSPTNTLDQIVADAYRWYNSNTFKYISR